MLSENLDAEGRAVDHGGVSVTVQQRLADQIVHDCPEPSLGPYCCLGSPSQVVVAAGQQVGDIGRASQRRRVLSVVARSCRFAAGREGGVVVVG
jgi:hypothetical protein